MYGIAGVAAVHHASAGSFTKVTFWKRTRAGNCCKYMRYGKWHRYAHFGIRGRFLRLGRLLCIGPFSMPWDAQSGLRWVNVVIKAAINGLVKTVCMTADIACLIWQRWHGLHRTDYSRGGSRLWWRALRTQVEHGASCSSLNLQHIPILRRNSGRGFQERLLFLFPAVVCLEGLGFIPSRVFHYLLHSAVQFFLVYVFFDG